VVLYFFVGKFIIGFHSFFSPPPSLFLSAVIKKTRFFEAVIKKTPEEKEWGESIFKKKK